jgi:hypothetical protein
MTISTEMVQASISMLADDNGNVREMAHDTITTFLRHSEHCRVYNCFWFNLPADGLREIIYKLGGAQTIVLILNSENWAKRESALKVLMKCAEHGKLPHRRLQLAIQLSTKTTSARHSQQWK